MALWCQGGLCGLGWRKPPPQSQQFDPTGCTVELKQTTLKIQHQHIKRCQGVLEAESWQELSHGMMWGLNQLSSTVHTVCTWSLLHHTNPRTSQWRWPGLHLHERGRYFTKLHWNNNASDGGGGCLRVFVRLCERVMNHKAARPFHSSSLKTITCCPCRWQRQWCGPRFSFDLCGQGRVVLMRPDILMIHVCGECECFFLSSNSLCRRFMRVTQCMLHHNDDSLHFLWSGF